jgi:hypothetical protein
MEGSYQGQKEESTKIENKRKPGAGTCFILGALPEAKSKGAGAARRACNKGYRRY